MDNLFKEWWAYSFVTLGSAWFDIFCYVDYFSGIRWIKKSDDDVGLC